MKFWFTTALLLLAGLAQAQLISTYDENSASYGYKNIQGEWVIAPQYKLAESFQDGLAAVKKGDRYGLIDESNKVVIPFDYFSLYRNENGWYCASEAASEKYGFLDNKGKVVIPFQYEDASNFSEGLAAVRTGGKWGFINTSNQMVIPAEYYQNVEDELDFFSFDLGYSFQQGTCSVPKNGLYGVIDKTGKTLVDFKYMSIVACANAQLYIAELCDEAGENCRFGVVNQANQTLIPFEFSYIRDMNGAFALYQGSTLSWLTYEPTGGFIGFASYSGKIISPCIYDNDGYRLYENIGRAMADGRLVGTSISQSIILASKNGKWGYLDLNGTEIIPFQFDDATIFYRDSARVTVNESSFFINRQGQCIKNCPENFKLATKSDKADQSQNIQLLMDGVYIPWVEEWSRYGGEELLKRQQAALDQYQPVFDEVISYGTKDQVNFSKILLINLAHSVGSTISKTSSSKALPYLRRVRYIAYQIPSSDFPVKFMYRNEPFQYDYSAYESRCKSYYVTLAECEYLTRDPLAVQDLKLALSKETNQFNLALFNSYLIDHKQNLNQYDQELLDYSTALLTKYVDLQEFQRRKLDSLELWFSNQPAAVEAAFTSKVSTPIPAEFYYRNYESYLKINSIANANYFLEKAYKSGYNDTSFLWKVIAHYKSINKTDEAAGALDKIASRISDSSCTELITIADGYTDLGMQSKANDYRNRAKSCNEDQERARVAAEKEQRRKERRYQSDYHPNPGVYFGFDLFPALSRVKGHRDYGIALNIVGRKSAHEFYYEIINANKDQMFDLSYRSVDNTDAFDLRWTGTQYGYGFKSYTDDERNVPYIGFYARYRQKKFDPVVSSATDANGAFVMAEKTFHPTEEQYEFLLNYGYMTTKRGLAMDIYFGFGPKYSRFKRQVEDYNSEWTYSHPLIEHRYESRWGLGLRIGMTIGLKF